MILPTTHGTFLNWSSIESEDSRNSNEKLYKKGNVSQFKARKLVFNYES